MPCTRAYSHICKASYIPTHTKRHPFDPEPTNFRNRKAHSFSKCFTFEMFHLETVRLPHQENNDIYSMRKRVRVRIRMHMWMMVNSNKKKTKKIENRKWNRIKQKPFAQKIYSNAYIASIHRVRDCISFHLGNIQWDNCSIWFHSVTVIMRVCLCVCGYLCVVYVPVYALKGRVSQCKMKIVSCKAYMVCMYKHNNVYYVCLLTYPSASKWHTKPLSNPYTPSISPRITA